ncbi:hypothetical protein CXB51_014439 [Gossypium anomalum]|uniref:Exostosin GT47 domain-containing protein n=1 Tax=Gossypium anomalum TaxID=47600 RepID=A0A8J6D2N1_9ROSI|nr:hypothetical protein CXB51_014439 [Gossypium anomalum]
MGHELKSWFQLDARKLIWLICAFMVIITFQYLELSENVLMAVVPSGKISIEGQSSFLASAPSSTESDGTIRYVTHSIDLEYNGTYAGSETVHGNEVSEERDMDSNDDVISETDVDLNKSSTFEEGSESPKESLTEELVDLIKNSTVYDAESSKNKTTAEVEGGLSLELNKENNMATLDSLNQTSAVNEATNGFGTYEVNDKDQNSDFILDNDNNSGRKSSSEEFEDYPESYNNKTVTKEAPTTIADMNNLFYRSRISYHSTTPRWASAADKVLLNVRSQIEKAPILENYQQLYAPLYRNVSMFKRSYELMESTLKVYIYKEGKKPIFHKPVLKGIYASEGWFMKQLQANRNFVTKKPREAQLFYLPFSSRMLEETLYVPDSHSIQNLVEYLKNYVDTIAAKYPYWNRTQGADHFLVACHDWEYMANCIRALCNSDIREGYTFGKDVSLPETTIRNPQRPLRDLGGEPPSKRSILAFFAGGMHGYLRPILLQQWGNKDPDMKIFGTMHNGKGKLNYAQHMKRSKYCICPRGYEVNSPRVVEAIFYECVPVIISDNFVPPFFEVLNWESLAVFVLEKDIPNLKKILLSIPDERYRQMQLSVKKAQQHFLWHPRPVKYDIFHMILHSVWYNRVLQMKKPKVSSFFTNPQNHQVFN